MAERLQHLPDWFESRSFTLSLAFHLLLVLLGLFGLPALLPERSDPVPVVMTVDILPISEMTNVKPSDKPITEKKEVKQPLIKKAPTPTVKEPPKPAQKEVPKPVEKEPEPEEKPFDPDEGAEKPVKKETPKEQPKQEQKFEDLLKNLQNEADKSSKDAKDDTAVAENKTRSDAPYDDSMPLSISEQDAIRNQFIPCWSPPMGAKDVNNLVVVVKAQYKDTGELIDVKLRSDLQGRYSGDAFFRAAADSAIRAVHRCSPLKNLDASKYGSWRDMELTFDPKMYF